MTAIRTNLLYSVALSAVVALLLAWTLLLNQTPKAQGAGGVSGSIGYVATSSSQVAVTVSTRLLATTTNTQGTGYTRAYTSICNPNANPVYLNLDGDKPASVNGGQVTTVIAAAAGYNACYEIRDYNAYYGSITASSTNETSTKINVKDYVQ